MGVGYRLGRAGATAGLGVFRLVGAARAGYCPMMRRLVALFLAILLAGCASAPRPLPCDPGAGTGLGVWLLDRGWHTELALPPGSLEPALLGLAGRPGAGFVAFGFGKRDFVLAEGPDLAAWLTGPIPGPAVVEVTTRPWLPDGAIWLPLSQQGLAALQGFLAASVTPDLAPVRVHGRQSFFAATRGYSLNFTCNTWVAEALAVAGLPVRADGVRLTRGVLGQVARLPRACAV